MSKNRFSYFFAIVMVVIALGLIFLGDDEPRPSPQDSSPEALTETETETAMEEAVDATEEVSEAIPSDESGDIVEP